MHEHVARALYYLDVHLLYASIVWFAAWVLTSIRGGSATTKYWIWVATALNFSLPLGAALDKVWAAHLSWATPLSVVGLVADGISRNAAAVAVLCAVWLLGAISMLPRLCLRLRADRRDARAAVAGQGAPARGPSLLAHGIPVRSPAAGKVRRSTAFCVLTSR